MKLTLFYFFKDKQTGLPLHPAILWNDTRTQSVLDRILAGNTTTSSPTTPTTFHKDFAASSERQNTHETVFKHPVNRPNLFEFEQVCGLPFSTYFSGTD